MEVGLLLLVVVAAAAAVAVAAAASFAPPSPLPPPSQFGIGKDSFRPRTQQRQRRCSSVLTTPATTSFFIRPPPSSSSSSLARKSSVGRTPLLLRMVASSSVPPETFLREEDLPQDFPSSDAADRNGRSSSSGGLSARFALHLRNLSSQQGGGGSGNDGGDGGSRRRRRRKMSRSQAAKLADDELRRMERLWWNDGGDREGSFEIEDGVVGDDPRENSMSLHWTGPVLMPDARSYAAVVSAYAKSGAGRDGAERAEAVLIRLEDLWRKQRRKRRRRSEEGDGDGGVASAEEEEEEVEAQLRPNAVLYTSVINAWSRAGDGRRAQAVLDRMDWADDDDDDDTGIDDKPCRPDVVACSSVIDAWANTRPKPSAIARRTRVEGNDSNDDSKLDEADVGNENNEPVARAEALLSRMRALSSSSFSANPSLRPNAYTYTALIKLYSIHLPGEAGAAEAESVLQEMKSLHAQGDTSARPNAYAYTAVMNAHSKSERGMEGVRRVESLLEELVEAWEASGPPGEREEDLRPTVKTYTCLMDAYARSNGGKVAADRALELLGKLERGECGDEAGDVSPNARTYTSALLAASRSGEPDGAQRALDVLRRMRPGLRDARAYACVVHALAKSDDAGSASEADDLLMEMYDLSTAARVRGRRMDPPDETTHAAVIHAYRRASEKGAVDRSMAAERCDALLRQMVQLRLDRPRSTSAKRGKFDRRHHNAVDRWLFNDVLRVIGHSGRANAVDMCEGVLDLMEGLADRTLTTAASSSAEEDKERRPSTAVSSQPRWEKVGPNSASYTFAVDSIVLSSAPSLGPAAGDRAMELVRRCERRHALHPRQCGSPDARCVSAALEATLRSVDAKLAMAKRRPSSVPGEERKASFVSAGSPHTPAWEEAERAESLLLRLVRLNESGDATYFANARLFARVMTALIKAKGPDYLRKVLDLFRYMRDEERLHHRDRRWEALRPNTVCYNVIINALAKSGERGSASKAEELVRSMEERYRAGEEDVKPDVVTYGAVIGAWANNAANEKGSSQNAERHLSTLEEAYDDGRGDRSMRPNALIYNGVILALARSRRKGAARRAEELLAKMEKLYREGDDRMRPDVRAYTSVVNAYARSREQGSAQKAEKMLRAAERRAREDAKKEKRQTRDNGDRGRGPSHMSGSRTGNDDDDAPVSPFLPDVALYSAVINAHAKGRAPDGMEKAEALFDDMVQLYHRGGRQGLRPNAMIMDTLIHGWATSKDKLKAERARSVLDRMKEMESSALASSVEEDNDGDADADAVVKRDVFAYTWVIYAAATSEGYTSEEKEHFFAIALDAFQEVHRLAESERRREHGQEEVRRRSDREDAVDGDAGGDAAVSAAGGEDGSGEKGGRGAAAAKSLPSATILADSYVYAFFLKACHRLLPPGDERDNLALGALNAAVLAGMVNKHVLSVAMRLIPRDVEKMFREEGRESGVELGNIPEGWCRNVRNWGGGWRMSVAGERNATAELDAL